MMVNALPLMEVDGTMLHCCIDTMGLMRKHKEHILGLLEAFIYDPLLQWTTPSTEVSEGFSADSEKQQSASAVNTLSRIQDKLEGNDFQSMCGLSVEDQVDKLIHEAMSTSNLCCMFRGWFPWW